jgi:hypothetical protein
MNLHINFSIYVRKPAAIMSLKNCAQRIDSACDFLRLVAFGRIIMPAIFLMGDNHEVFASNRLFKMVTFYGRYILPSRVPLFRGDSTCQDGSRWPLRLDFHRSEC